MRENLLISIVGPTAVGKTHLAISIAEYFQTEIISSDSRQFYKEMDIGTAKPSNKELLQIKHHFINSHSIQEELSAGEYERQGIALLHQLFTAGRDIFILVGGSGLYVNALLHGLDELSKNKEIKNELINQYEQKGLDFLVGKLKELDPEYASQADLKNPVRVIRALEIIQSSGKPYSAQRKNKSKERNFSILKIGLEIPREELYSRINNRVDLMIAEGLEEEVRNLIPYQNTPALQTVGYKEFFEYFKGNIDRAKAIELIKRNSRRYAKRQLTWFKKDIDTHWFHPSETEKIIEHIKDFRQEKLG